MGAEHLVLRETMAERLAVVLRQCILQLRPGFEPGGRIDIKELASSFSVSTTPVKEALKRLESNGLVQVRARHGVFVTVLTRREVEEILTVRAELEQMAVRLCQGQVAPPIRDALERCHAACEAHVAAERADEYRREDMAFHRLLVEFSGNKRLVALYQVLLEQSQAALVFTPRTARNIQASLAEHRRLLNVLQQGNLAAIEKEVAEHWERSKVRVLDGYAAYLQGVSPEA